MANNLELQGGTYHVRLAVPADVRTAFGNRRILSQSLMTGVHQEALDRRLPILAKWKSQIKIARDGKPLPDDWQDPINAAVGELDAQKKLRKLAIIGEEVVPSTMASEARDWKKQNPEASMRLERLVDEYTALGVEGEILFTNMINMSAKLYIERAFNKKHKLSGEQQHELVELLNGSYKPKSPISKARLAAFRSFRTSRNVNLKTIDQQQSKLEKLSAFLTDTGRNLDFDAISSWLDSLKLASKTLTQYLLAGSVFWKWALKHDAYWREEYRDRANPFENHDLPKVTGKVRADAQRRDFTLEDLSSLHAAALTQGLTVLADLILLGTYTGARIEELCQLRTGQVITVDGIQSFDITDSKTKAGIRVVPVHPALADVVKRLIKDSKDDYLVCTNSRSKYGIRSDPMVKAFGRLKTGMGFGAQHVYHSIRKTAITQLVRAGVQGTLIAELVGHETGLVTFDVYSQGASAAQKLEAICKLPKLQ